MDSAGRRTLGVITKPDTLPAGSESESGFVALAKNEDVEFILGWHVLRNRNYESRESSTEARDAVEAQFFDQKAWASLSRASVGIANLRIRLSHILLEQTKAELPSLVKDIQDGIEDCEKQLDKLGERRATVDQQRLFLFQISQEFQSPNVSLSPCLTRGR